jgi:hypothetical protein
MDDNQDFRELWKKQTATPVSTDELLQKLNKLKKSQFNKMILSTAALSLTSIFIIWIWIVFDPQMATTKYGIILIILAMAIFGYSYNRQYPILKQLDISKSNSEYLESLIALKRKQHHLHSTMLSLYFVMLGIGIVLYMIEYTMRMTTFWAIFAYTITLAWIAFNWFFIRPRTIKKQQGKIDELISRFSNISEQLH